MCVCHFSLIPVKDVFFSLLPMSFLLLLNPCWPCYFTSGDKLTTVLISHSKAPKHGLSELTEPLQFIMTKSNRLHSVLECFTALVTNSSDKHYLSSFLGWNNICTCILKYCVFSECAGSLHPTPITPWAMSLRRGDACAVSWSLVDVLTIINNPRHFDKLIWLTHTHTAFIWILQ